MAAEAGVSARLAHRSETAAGGPVAPEIPALTTVAAASPYDREFDVALRDGSTVHVRPVRAGDAPHLLAFYRGWSPESVELRFFSGAVNLEAEAQREAQLERGRGYALVATTGEEGRVVGHGCSMAIAGDRAEVAFGVADEYQGRGLCTLLLGRLAEVAAANGIGVFEAEVLPYNHQMLDVLRQSGFTLKVQSEPGALHVTFPTSVTPEAVERFEQREQIAAASALRSFLAPRAVAVVGASRRRGTVGGELFHNLLAYQFAGPVYPVNPAAAVVQSVPAYHSVDAIPGAVDLAVLAVPAAHVVEAARQCARKGVRALVVVSAGFGETGEAGRRLQNELLDVCRATGMRLIGPNCIGIVNTDPAVRLNANFGPLMPTPGSVGFSSQSGALGLAAIDYAASLGMGISSFVSAGNKADISGNDLLNYWETDPRTRVILLYLESFGNPRKFSRIARRVGHQKPIVVVKSGRSAAGARATSSHTGALLAAADVTVDALFRQAGVIRTDTLEQLFDTATLLASQPLPTGSRVGIITNAGGPGILCADTAEAEGLQVPVLAPETQARLHASLPAEASATNPVDMIATATAADYRHALDAVMADPSVDSVIAIFLQPLVTRAGDVAAALAAGARQLRAAGVTKPLLSVFMACGGAPAALSDSDLHIPSYAFPESAPMALARAVRYAEWRARPIDAPPALPGIRRDEAVSLVAGALGRGGGWLTPGEVATLCACYGLPLAAQGIAPTPEAAGDLAESLPPGAEVALKAIVPSLLHKTEAGAVRLRLAGKAQVTAAAQEMAATIRHEGRGPEGYLVQRMVPPGVEMIVGIVHDVQFGPVVACGAGGVLVELLKDVAVRLAPLTSDDAHEMVRGLKSAPLLTGYRGSAPCDVAALEDVLLRVSTMAEDLPQIAELDCNPVIVRPDGASIVDARIRVAPADPPPPLGARR